jgi:hypothetical protein
MATRKFTPAQLEEKTAVELKRMCVQELGIPGMTKKPKQVVVNAILAKYGATTTASVAPSAAPAASGKVTGVEFSGHSVLTNPGAPFGHKTSTTIRVSSGASSGNFPVVGKKVAEVGEFLREVLNVDKLSTGLVNGKEVGGDYILKTGDTLEFLKPAGKKGC